MVARRVRARRLASAIQIVYGVYRTLSGIVCYSVQHTLSNERRKGGDVAHDDIVSSMVLELRRGTLVMLVLGQLREPAYGYALVKTLADHGIPIEANTLYPLMRRLEAQGLLTSEWDNGTSKPRKYYRTTDEGVRVLGGGGDAGRCGIVALNLGDVDSAAVGDALNAEFGICTRAGAHCAPLMHEALGTEQQGAVRFSFSSFNTLDEVDAGIAALAALAEEG